MGKGEKFLDLLKNRRGSTSVIFVCSAIFVMLLSALVTDIGYVAFERYKMDRTLDRIARLGAVALMEDKDECMRVIKDNVLKSISNINKLDINISDNNREMSITIERKLDYVFLKYLGLSEKQIGSKVTAKISNVTSFKGIRPFAIKKSEIDYEKQCYLSTSQETVSKRAGDVKYQRLIPLNLGKGNFETSIIYGFNKTVYTGDGIYALPESQISIRPDSINKLTDKCKNEPDCTYENYEDDCPRIIILPVVDSDEASGNKAMGVLGFTTFFVEDSEYKTENDKGSVVLKGRFIKYTVDSSTSDGISDFGLLGVKLKHW